MKKATKLLVIILITSIVFSACAKKYNAEEDFEAEAIDGGKAVRITNYVGKEWTVNIPPKIRGLPVTHIGKIAFEKKSLINVTIPNNVTHIERGAFRDNQLTSVTIPNSVTTIEVFAFGWNQMTSITIPNSVTSLSGFNHNQLTSVTIPNSVTTIESFAFSDNQLISVTIPNSVTTIRSGAFSDNQPTSITIGANVNIYEAFTYEDEKYLFNSIGFEEAYNSNAKAAGTYTRPNTNSTTWTRQ